MQFDARAHQRSGVLFYGITGIKPAFFAWGDESVIRR
jgi:hypothetical protein